MHLLRRQKSLKTTNFLSKHRNIFFLACEHNNRFYSFIMKSTRSMWFVYFVQHILRMRFIFCILNISGNRMKIQWKCIFYTDTS